LVPLPEPYPGSNLFSLASGGAIFLRDPRRTLVEQQLNGGKFARLTGADWDLIRPHLEENQRLFGITLEQLLTDKGRNRKPAQIYRKVLPGNAAAITAEETDDVEAALAAGALDFHQLLGGDVVAVVGGVSAGVTGADGVLDFVDGAAVFRSEAAEEHPAALMRPGLLAMLANRVVELQAQAKHVIPPRTAR